MSKTFTLGYLQAFSQSLEAILGQNPWLLSAKGLVDKLIELKDDPNLQNLIKSQKREFHFFLIERMKELDTDLATLQKLLARNCDVHLDASRKDPATYLV